MTRLVSILDSPCSGRGLWLPSDGMNRHGIDLPGELRSFRSAVAILSNDGGTLPAVSLLHEKVIRDSIFPIFPCVRAGGTAVLSVVSQTSVQREWPSSLRGERELI